MHVCAVCSHKTLHAAMSESVSIAKARNKLTVDEKCRIARRKVSTGDSDEKVAAWFNHVSGKQICQTVVGKAVHAGFQDLSPYEPDKNRCRRRAPMWPLLDEGLFSWFNRYVFAIEFERIANTDVITSHTLQRT